MPRRTLAITLALLGALGVTPLVAADDPEVPAPPVYLAVDGASLVSLEMETSQSGSLYRSDLRANLSIMDLRASPISTRRME